MTWRSEALCRAYDADLWFAPEEHPDTTKAVAICRRCDVREACLEFAMSAREDDGVYGGLTGRQRVRVRRGRPAGTRRRRAA